MKIGKLRTTWLVTRLCFHTLMTSLRCIAKCYFGKPSRTWVDEELNHWVDQLLKTLKVDYKVINPSQTEPVAGRATILMCNHSSAYDIPLGLKIYPKRSIRMLAKRELSKVPFLGKAMKAAEFPFIDRKNRYQAIKDLAYAKELMQSGVILWIAPEGTRSKDGKLHPFKKGGFITAIESQALIIPVGVRGAYSIVPAHSLNVNLNQKAEIHIGKPIDAADFSLENIELLIEKTYAAIKELVGED